MENKIKGGLADGKTIEDIARKHSVFVGTIKLALEKGIKVELEHTSDRKVAREIAMDHLWEDYEYYDKLEKMEKKETKEQTDASCSGSYEAPMSTTVLKRDIYKLAEQIDSGQYDGPIGTAGPSSPKDHTKKKRKDPLELDEKTKSASVTAASTEDMISTKKGFPRYGGPKTKFVEINPACKSSKTPCNQGADSDGAWKPPKNIKLIEGMKEAIESAAKKYGISIKEVEKMVMKEAYNLPVGIDMTPASTWGKNKVEKNYLYELTTVDPTTNEPIPLIFKTKSESDFAKLKMLLQGNDIKFHEDKRQLEGNEEIKKPYDPLQSDPGDDFGDDEDDIFANMK